MANRSLVNTRFRSSPWQVASACSGRFWARSLRSCRSAFSSPAAPRIAERASRFQTPSLRHRTQYGGPGQLGPGPPPAAHVDGARSGKSLVGLRKPRLARLHVVRWRHARPTGRSPTRVLACLSPPYIVTHVGEKAAMPDPEVGWAGASCTRENPSGATCRSNRVNRRGEPGNTPDRARQEFHGV